MCIYKNDKIDYLRSAINSTIKPHELNIHLYIFVDGPVSNDIKTYLNNIELNHNISIHYSSSNVGLAAGLNYLIDNKVPLERYEYIARMDADDINHEDRFQEQLRIFETKNVDVVGCECIEIDENGSHLFYKNMPTTHDEIINQIIKRCPFIHPSVMFKSDVFKKGFRYNPNLKNTQDYYLWVDLASNGFKFYNISKPLIYFRTDQDFFKRRSTKKLINELKGRLIAMNSLNLYSTKNLLYIAGFLVLRLSPEFIAKFAYKKLR